MTRNIKKIFGQRVRSLRKAKRWSQEKLSEETGLHRTYISGVERGERNISLENIENIATALDVDIALMFMDERKML